MRDDHSAVSFLYAFDIFLFFLRPIGDFWAKIARKYILMTFSCQKIYISQKIIVALQPFLKYVIPTQH